MLHESLLEWNKMKQYEYAIEYIHEDTVGFTETFGQPSYEDALDMAKWLHKRGATEVRIIRREVSDWKLIHQSGI